MEDGPNTAKLLKTADKWEKERGKIIITAYKTTDEQGNKYHKITKELAVAVRRWRKHP